MKSEIHQLIDERRNPEQQKVEFQKAQAELDFRKLYDILFHTAAQYCKKMQGKYWSTNKIIDTANDITIFIMHRYEKNPAYRVGSHVTVVALAYRNIVQDHYKKREALDAMIDEIPVEEHFAIA